MEISIGKYRVLVDEDFDTDGSLAVVGNSTVVVRKDGKSTNLARILTAAGDTEIVTFRNGNSLDLRGENLEVVERSAFTRTREYMPGITGIRGVVLVNRPSDKVFRASFMERGKRVLVGYFTTAQEAAKALQGAQYHRA